MALIVFQFLILIFSVIIHEVSHGAMAEYLGDSTAKEEGRLSLNPIRHFDPVGSFIFPVSLFLLTQGKFFFGWAKPVPFNPLRLKNPKRDSGLVGLAGPLSNVLVAVFFGIFFRLARHFGLMTTLPFLADVVQVNLVLAIFNAVPIPPLDGSKIIAAFLPDSWDRWIWQLERYSIFILMFFVLFGFDFLVPIINFLYSLIIGA